VVGHKAEAKDLDLGPLFAHNQQVGEGLVIAGLAEDLQSAIAAVEHVINQSADGRSGCAWHAWKRSRRRRVVKRWREMVDVTNAIALSDKSAH